MRMYDLIKKKRDGKSLTAQEIKWFIENYVNGTIPDYQVSALLMAIYFNGMDLEETTALTFAVRDSGDTLDFSDVKGIRVDKHSTGGVGDKTSLIVAPIVATLGVKVAKMSGRGLGHTGGTVDKLESIPGFNTGLGVDEFLEIVNRVGIAIVGQSAELAPADKLLYALRDVTATVESLPLIVSSIMGKKLAADDDCIVLDVKTGSGSFMKTVEDSKRLARLMVDIGKQAGKKMLALITDMDRPLGFNIGNILEVKEAVETLRGKGPSDLTEICIALAAHMLSLAEKGTYEECEAQVKQVIADGSALKTFADMVEAQGGDSRVIYDTSLFKEAKFSRVVKAEKSGYIVKVDTEGYGTAALLLGAGRNTKEDKIDFTAGIILSKKTGDFVKAGEAIATLYTNSGEKLDAGERKLIESTVIGDEKPAYKPIILDKVQ
ncbi:MAG: pyrimidine-nucleoside phosphorylase [Clostridia bacterium]|nr:pyrimidine-nucleoside phosphorylase [Clostridia bacterium]MBR6688049.1 pyrimidine-nucleoside phosphorylase [Clostridia bacterium]